MEKDNEIVAIGTPSKYNRPISGQLKILKIMKDLDQVTNNDVVLISNDVFSSDNLISVYRSIQNGAAGIILLKSGRTDHGIIAANELDVPCIYDCRFLRLNDVKDGDIITISGDKIYRGNLVDFFHNDVLDSISFPSTSTKIKINLGFPEVLKKKEHIITVTNGVGFMRLEFVLLDILNNEHPLSFIQREGEEHLASTLYKRLYPAVKSFHLNNKDVWIRTDDFSTEQLFQMTHGEKYEEKETNPMLGWRGITRSIDDSRILNPQLLAIRYLMEKGLDNIGLFPPMTRLFNEYQKWKSLAVENELSEIKYGLMVETPSAALTFNRFVKHINFMIFGTNDLTSLTLAVDRSNSKLQSIFDEKNEAVLSLMKNVLQTCQKNDIESCIGGQAGSDCDLMNILLTYGIDGTSVNPDLNTISMISNYISSFEKKLITS